LCMGMRVLDGLVEWLSQGVRDLGYCEQRELVLKE
jgi:hypothetical protein